MTCATSEHPGWVWSDESWDWEQCEGCGGEGCSHGPVMSARQGRNEECFADALALHLPPPATVADVTYGEGRFWGQVEGDGYDLLATDLATGTDCRSLPYDDLSLDGLVLDPPYIYNPKGTVKDSLSGTYNVNGTEGLRSVSDVVGLYAAGLAEARRVVKKGGKVFVKCQDTIEAGKQRWVHIEVHDVARALGLKGMDLFVLMTESAPTQRWEHQKHARKNHSYLWVFERRETMG